MTNNIINTEYINAITAKLITNGNENNQLIYFTSRCVTSDNKYLIYICETNGNPNIHALNIQNGMTIVLSDNNDGYLRSYQYFNGNVNKGLAKASISLHPDSGTIYYIQGNELLSVDLEGNIKMIDTISRDQITAYTHVSHDGTRLCVPTTDSRAIETKNITDWKPNHNIDERIQNENLNSYLNIYDTIKRKKIITEKIPRAWVTHVQFRPTNTQIILYNHEWPSFNPGARRLWVWDGKKHIQLRKDSNQTSKNDWVCHEMWSSDGNDIIYHGMHKNKNHFIGKIEYDTNNTIEINMLKEFNEYGHFTIGGGILLISDGYLKIDKAKKE